MDISIGVPVRNEETNLEEFIERLTPILEAIGDKGFSVEVIVNNNKSEDASLNMLRSWAEIDTRIKVYDLTESLTYQQSIQDLMVKAKGKSFVVLQSDLQDPPELILDFLSAWTGGAKVVIGVIESRKEKILNRLPRSVFYSLLRMSSDGNFYSGFQDFYLIDQDVYQTIRELPREGLFLRGHISSRFGNVVQIKYDRSPRVRGESNFRFADNYSLALDGLLLFGTRLIRFISVFSFCIFVLAVCGINFLLFALFFGFQPGIRGWMSTVVAVLTVLSILGMGTGLILEYLIRIYRTLIFANRG